MTTSFSDHSRSAVLQVPVQGGNGGKRGVECTFNGMQGKRLSVEASEGLAVSTPVSVEYNDALFLGEVVSCAPTGETWTVEIKVEQILSGLQSLMALRAHLLTESVPQPLGLPVNARN